MSEVSRKVTIAEIHGPILVPDSPYRMWVDGTLDDYLRVPDGSRVEIIDGEIVVSPAPITRHNHAVRHLAGLFYLRGATGSAYRWREYQTEGLNFLAEESGFIPDLLVLDRELEQEALQGNARELLPDQVELVVEVTSEGSASVDRPPTAGQRRNKWRAYARAEIPYYLLVDLDPQVATTTLYSIPDPASAAYLHSESWALGETTVLPDPLTLEIPTDTWLTWA
ncbi:Uma2 family endonuclease [Nonomuraea sp. NPDC050310]|uniref:Uma2 family endonuclease n=1 Tax=Nonomuraea sp. NPDC050310 TaxID=3154935 RepID=UPI0033DD1D74